jgi:CRP-like cAMP-binding protein
VDVAALMRKVEPTTPSPEQEVSTGATSPLATLLGEVRQKEQQGDVATALDVLDTVLDMDPANGEAMAFLARNEKVVLERAKRILGGLHRVPHVAVNPSQLAGLKLDDKSGFILSRVDGRSSYEDLVSLSGMSRLETCRLLARLVQGGILVT